VENRLACAVWPANDERRAARAAAAAAAALQKRVEGDNEKNQRQGANQCVSHDIGVASGHLRKAFEM
jgi:hypothetical protein